MQSDLQKRIFANVLLGPSSGHSLGSRRKKISFGTVVSLAIVTASAMGLVLLMLSKLDALPH